MKKENDKFTYKSSEGLSKVSEEEYLDLLLDTIDSKKEKKSKDEKSKQ